MGVCEEPLINGIKINEAKDHVSTEIDYVGGAPDRKEDTETHGVKITPSRNKVQDSDHRVSGPRENVRKFLVHHYGDKAEAEENHPEVFRGMNKVNHEQLVPGAKEADFDKKLTDLGAAMDRTMAAHDIRPTKPQAPNTTASSEKSNSQTTNSSQLAGTTVASKTFR